jgi:hypothetical protein
MPDQIQKQDPSPQRVKLKLEVAKKDDTFVVQDASGVIYGPQVKTRKDAEELLKDWKAYYAECLTS